MDQLLIKKWQINLLNTSCAVDVESISETIESLFDFLEGHGPAALNLTLVQTCEFNRDHLAAILRATAFIQDEIEGWAGALEQAVNSFLQHNEDPYDALYGLIAPKKS